MDNTATRTDALHYEAVRRTLGKVDADGEIQVIVDVFEYLANS